MPFKPPHFISKTETNKKQGKEKPSNSGPPASLAAELAFPGRGNSHWPFSPEPTGHGRETISGGAQREMVKSGLWTDGPGAQTGIHPVPRKQRLKVDTHRKRSSPEPELGKLRVSNAQHSSQVFGFQRKERTGPSSLATASQPLPPVSRGNGADNQQGPEDTELKLCEGSGPRTP